MASERIVLPLLLMMMIYLCFCAVCLTGQRTESDCARNAYAFHDEIAGLRKELAAQGNQLKAQLNAIERRLRDLCGLSPDPPNQVTTSTTSGTNRDTTCRPRDCAELRILGNIRNDVYQIFPKYQWKQNTASAYCEFNESEAWVVFQRRKDGSVDFDRNWMDYVTGFGDPYGEFWLGNENLHILTSSKKYKLRIELEDYDGFTSFAEYSTFSIASSAEKYRLTVFGYYGNAGDSLSDHNGEKFSTKDSDNDSGNGHCAEICHSGWWFNNCYDSNLNGRYLRGQHRTTGGGIEWVKWRGNRHSLKSTVMKIRPTE